MFWRVNSVNKNSPIEALLDRDNFTLEELLEEDDVIQVCNYPTHSLGDPWVACKA